MKKHSLIVISIFAALFSITQTLTAQARLSDYTVGPQDVLQITTLGEPDMSGPFRVDADGSISFGLLGRVTVGGLTTTAIEAKLTAELVRRQIFNPGKVQISVDVKDFRSRSVFIMGAVKAQNEYRLTGDMTLIAAIAQAGGLSESASDDISIMRPKGGQPLGALTPEKAQNADITIIKWSDVLKGDAAQNIALQDGDTIWVPTAERFYIQGYVRNVGPYIYQRGLNVQQALTLAGGITELGSDKRITIDRTVNNKKKQIKAKLEDLVMPGDLIKVERRRF